MTDILRLAYGFEVRAMADEKRSVDVVASTSAIDAYGEIVVQDWDLKRYQANPVVLFGHNSYDLPIGHASDVRVEEGKLLATLHFVDEKASPMAERVWQGIKQGSLRAVSVGFRTKGKPATVDVDGKPVLALSQNELIEISVVPIPANPEAVAMAAKSLETIRAMARDGDKPMKDLLKKLGLEEKATEAEALKALDVFLGLRELVARVLEETGAKSVDEAIGHIKAWQEASKKVDELQAKVAEHEKAASDRERDSIIDKAKAAGKITPAMLDWAKACPIESLKAFVEVAPTFVPNGSVEQPSVQAPKGGDITKLVAEKSLGWKDLTPMQKHLLREENMPLYEQLKSSAGA